MARRWDRSFIYVIYFHLWYNLGIGARRIEITEEHRVFRASTLYFRAGKSHSRRTASIGPGVYYNETNSHRYYNETDNLRYNDDYVSYPNEAPTFATVPATRPSTDGNTSNSNNELNSLTQRTSSPTPPSSFFLNQRMNRRLSVDASHFRRMSFDEDPRDLHMQNLPPIPSYSPFAPPVAPDSSHFPTAHGVNGNLDPRIAGHPPISPVHNEDSRHSSYANLRPSQSK